ncbi:MAG: PD40 domain-containing protein [Gemmatimonadaceae bacterium]|nr:PD40 domain-containing protein [Gemmatimonadaceae bacterium]
MLDPIFHEVRTAIVRAAAIFTVLVSFSDRIAAQDSTRADTAAKPAAKKDLPLKSARTVKFTTDEGTWLSLDVSPDARTIVFEMLGDLYTLPIAGGKAMRITDGMAFDAQPRYSPDGKHIVFVSDRNGSENVWVMDSDGKNARGITKMEKTQFVSPEWTPDGKYIAVSRNAAQWAPVYELYLYHKDGGSGVKMTNTASAPSGPPNPLTAPTPNNYVGAAFGKDSRFVYASTRQGSGGYNQTNFGWQISVYDRETGQTFARTNTLGGAMRPIVSPDGRYLVYATRADSATSLRLRDIPSGEESWLARNVQRDDQESRFTRDLMPGSAFTPDSRALITSYGGKIWRLDIPSGRASAIPFTADVDQGLGPLVTSEYKLNDSTLTVSQIRGARPSPDGKRLAFTALDKIWVMELPKGTPRRLTNSDRLTGEHSPVWSPDGQYVAYVTWAEEGGDVYRARCQSPVCGGNSRGRASGQPERLTRQSAFYEKLNYTPDGTRLVVARGPRQRRVEHDEFAGGDPAAAGVELVWLPATGGDVKTITPLTAYGYPHFARDNERIYIYNFRDGLVSMRFDGTDRKPILKVTGYVEARAQNPFPTPADEVLISPDGDRALVETGNHIYIVSIPQIGGQAPTVSVANPSAASVPVRRLTRIGGDFSGWVRQGSRVHYSIGHSYFTYDLARADSMIRDSTTRADSLKEAGGAKTGADSARTRVAARDSAQTDTAKAGKKPTENVALAGKDSAKVVQADTAKKSKPAYEPDRIDVLISVQRDRPKGTVVLRGARIITMKGDEVIENGDVVVTDNRIAAVGARGSVTIPAGAREIDMAGKTILPGWIDIHAHMWPPFGIHRTQVWEYLANMAYGVTTTRDPQTATTDVLSYGDLVETGDMIGPRVFSTGPGVFWSDDIKSLDDARDVLHRYTDFYNIHTIKQYMVGDRKVRQWVIMASKELGLTPTLEGGLDFKKNLTEAIDGYAGSEHSYPIAPLYKDAVQLLAQSGITYTPTLLVQYGGPWAENYWYQRHDILKDEKLRRFTPQTELVRRAYRRPGWWHESQYSFALLAEQAKKIVEAGGRVGLGGHGQLQGLGVHWELWSIASGGMKPLDVLRVGTIFGAEAIGLAKEIGSLEGGKLADLQVLDSNPLTDIKNTNTVRYVMKNGRLYDAGTMAEMWPRQRELARPWWWDRETTVGNGGPK